MNPTFAPRRAMPTGRQVRPVSNYRGQNQQGAYSNPQPSYVNGQATPQTAYAGGLELAPAEEITGVLDIEGADNHGVIRPRFKASEEDIYLPAAQIRMLGLRMGDMIKGMGRKAKEGERFGALIKVLEINGSTEMVNLNRRPKFEQLTPVYPYEKLTLETEKEPLSTRLIDLVAPIGKGQRGMIVSPPKAGKTTVIKETATGMAANYPEVHLMAVLVGERPEEVTDIARHILAVTKNSKMPGETLASNFDERPEDQVKVAEIALERAKRMVERGQDVVILLDSITRLARAYNLAIPTSGRTLSGGFDPAALFPPKRFFGAARKLENAGSLTIIGTALVDTGSRMDDLVYEEFKGTGNMELVLDRKLANRRIFPSVDVQSSGTRREDLLFDPMTYQSIVLMRRMLDMLNEGERTEVMIERLKKTKTNKEFLASLKG